MQFSVFRDVGQSIPDTRELAWPDDFRQWTEAVSPEDKLRVSLFSLDLYRPGTGREKGLTKSNVEAVQGLVLDYDDDHGVRVEQALAAWGAWDHVLYTTFSHTEGAHAFRVVLPFDKPMTVAQFEAFVRDWAQPYAKAQGAAFKKLPVAQMYFFPTKRPGHPHLWNHNRGPLLCPTEVWKPAAAPAPAPLPTNVTPIRSPLPAPVENAPRTGTVADVFRGIETAHEVADLPVLEQHCSFLRHGRENAATLSEPEWHSWLSVVVRTRGGRETGHKISSAYPRYNRSETDAKMDRLLAEAGPHSCSVIESRTQHAGCAACPLKGRVTGPLSIGRAAERTNASTTEEMAERLNTFSQRLALEEEIAAAEAALDAARRDYASLKMAEEARRRAARAAPTLGTLVGEDEVAVEARIRLEEGKRRVAEAEKTLKNLRARARSRGSLDGPNPDTLDALTTDDRGNPISSRLNVERVLTTDPAYAHAFTYDVFANKRLYDGQPAEDHKDTRLTLDLERRYGLRVEPLVVRQVADVIAHQNEFHPVKDFLRSLHWDGEERLHALMAKGFGSLPNENQTDAYLSDVGRKLCISAVARVMDPTAKNEIIVVATGKQGKKKSTGFKALAARPEWFGDSHLSISSKDAYMQLDGKWFYEIAELDSFKKAENTAIKSFVSSQSDTYRPPFGAHTITRHRNTIFVATTNEDQFLDDPTGTRRYAPVLTGEVNVEWIRANLAQIWAEAVVRFDRGERWWYEGDEADRLHRASADFRTLDPWADRVLTKIFEGTTGFFTVEKILTDWFTVPLDRVTKRERNRISSVMTQLGIPYVRIQQMKRALELGYTHCPRGYMLDDSVRQNLAPEYAPNVIAFPNNERSNWKNPDEVF